MAAAITAATTTNLLLRRLLHRPLLFTTTTTFTSSLLHSKPSLSLSSTLTFSTSTPPQTLTLETDTDLEKQAQLAFNGNTNGNGDGDGGNGRNVTVLDVEKELRSYANLTLETDTDLDEQAQLDFNGNGDGNGDRGNGRKVTVLDEKRKVPNLTAKEKKEVGSYASSLGDKLKSQQIGKFGVTDKVAFALSETLEKNELLKLKIHKSCPGELEDVVKQVEQATGSIVVGQIARTVILYRPSVSKLKAHEKREQHLKLFAQRKHKAKTAFMNQRKDQISRQPRRARNRRSEI